MAQSNLKAKLLEKIEAHRPRTTKLNKEFGNVVIDKVNIGQCIGGARDIRSLVTDISYLDPFEGIRFRGKTIPETFAALPKVPGKEQPFVEGFFWFLLTGEIPTAAQTQEVVEDWKSRARGSPVRDRRAARHAPRLAPHDDALDRGADDAARLDLRQEVRRGRPQEERHVGPDVRGLDEPAGEAAGHRRVHLPDEVQVRHPHPADSQARLGRQLRPHDGRCAAVRRGGPHVLHPPLGPRVGERLGAHHAPRGLGAVRRVLLLLRRPERPAGPLTASRTRKCSAGS